MRVHRTSWSTLIFGLIFAGGGVLLLTNGVGLVTRLDWIVPIFLILVALLLFASAIGDRARPVQDPPAAVPPSPWGGRAGELQSGHPSGCSRGVRRGAASLTPSPEPDPATIPLDVRDRATVLLLL
jgi:hypothetical protein